MANIYSGMSIRTRLLLSLAVVLSLSQLTACSHVAPQSSVANQRPRSASPNASATPDAPLYSCPRNVYNNTDCPWTFQADSRHGNVYFINGSCVQTNCTVQNGPCTLPPHCAVSIQYTTTNGLLDGNWVVTDRNGGARSWSYFSDYPAEQCPLISHSGNTGAINLNDPANGDLTAGGCTW